MIGAGAGVVLAAIIVRYVSGVFGGTTRPTPDPGPTEVVQPRLGVLR